MNRWLITAMVAVGVAASVSGCSGTETAPSHSPTAAAISQQQTDALEDGAITWDEYQTAFKAYQACLTKAGYTLTDPHVVDDLMEVGVPGDAVDSGVDDKCYNFHWSEVDGVWQIAHEDTSATAKWIAHCLESKGIAPKDKKVANDELLKRHGIGLDECPEVD